VADHTGGQRKAPLGAGRVGESEAVILLNVILAEKKITFCRFCTYESYLWFRRLPRFLNGLEKLTLGHAREDEGWQLALSSSFFCNAGICAILHASYYAT
jgi:hypothetical protein